MGRQRGLGVDSSDSEGEAIQEKHLVPDGRSRTSKTLSDAVAGKKPSRKKKLGNLNPKYWYINGVAYDFEPFIKKHPGGQYALQLGRGRECIGMLHSYHLNLPSQALLDRYRLPEEHQLSDAEKFPLIGNFTFEEDGFYNTLKKEVRQHFASKGLDHHADWAHVAFFFLNVFAVLAGMYLLCNLSENTPLWFVLFAIVWHGLWRGLMVVQTTHAASHFSLFKNPMANRWAYRVGTTLIGLWCPATWDVQHIVAHHIWTNQWPYDTDSAFPLKSILPDQRRFWIHRYQHIYAWLIYAFTTPLVMLNSLRELSQGHQALYRINFLVPGAFYEGWGCTAGALLYTFLPVFFLPLRMSWWVVGLTNILSSLFFSLQFVINHEVDCIIKTPERPEGSTVDWGEHQVNSSLTFGGDSWLALEMSGGLNTQVEHHLFPGIHYSHYRDVRRILKKLCQEREVEYQERENLLDALKAHYSLLKNPPPSIKSGSAKKGL